MSVGVRVAYESLPPRRAGFKAVRKHEETWKRFVMVIWAGRDRRPVHLLPLQALPNAGRQADSTAKASCKVTLIGKSALESNLSEQHA